MRTVREKLPLHGSRCSQSFPGRHDVNTGVNTLVSFSPILDGNNNSNETINDTNHNGSRHTEFEQQREGSPHPHLCSVLECWHGGGIWTAKSKVQKNERPSKNKG